MSYTPAPIDSRPLATIHTFAEEALGAQGRWGIALGSVNVATWVANLAIFVPIGIAEPFVVYEVFWGSGSTVTGNVDVGIYATDGTRLASLGAVSLGSASVVNNSTTWADYTLQPGDYYMAFSCSGTTNAVTCWIPTANNQAACGVGEMAAAHPLPASATIVPVTNALLPYFGLNGLTVPV